MSPGLLPTPRTLPTALVTVPPPHTHCESSAGDPARTSPPPRKCSRSPSHRNGSDVLSCRLPHPPLTAEQIQAQKQSHALPKISGACVAKPGSLEPRTRAVPPPAVRPHGCTCTAQVCPPCLGARDLGVPGHASCGVPHSRAQHSSPRNVPQTARGGTRPSLHRRVHMGATSRVSDPVQGFRSTPAPASCG